MRRSKRFEVLAQRAVNQDGLIGEWPEEGLIAMESPYDPASSVKVQNGRIVELDGKSREQFDMIDRFIADYAINVAETERAMRLDALEIARMLVDNGVVAGQGNIRGTEGPRNAVATGLVLSGKRVSYSK